jgi:electron transport complex protein RnfD
MFTVLAALLPAAFVSVYLFGLRAIALMATCVIVSLATEYIFQVCRKKDITLNDGSAALAGLLLALTLPPSFPLLGAALGSVVAIGLGKHIFGGLGFNIFNPALIGRAFLQAAFPVMITTWTDPFAWKASSVVDVVSAATPLSRMKFDFDFLPLTQLSIGNIGGSLGETSAIALLIGAAYLLYRGYIQWRIPASMLGASVLLGGIFWLIAPEKYPEPFFHVFAGGMILGAFYMATDMVTCPITPVGYWIFGSGIGILTIIIRLLGGLPEGVMYAILFMNAFTPIINRYTRPKILGEVRNG